MQQNKSDGLVGQVLLKQPCGLMILVSIDHYHHFVLKVNNVQKD